MSDLFSSTEDITDVKFKDYSYHYLARSINSSSYLLNNYSQWEKIKGKWYYFKEITAKLFSDVRFDSMKFLLNELLGVKLANFWDLDTISYLIGKNENSFYLLSENFRNWSAEYFLADELDVPSFLYGNTGIENILNLRYVCPNKENYYHLLANLFKMFALDFYSAQADRSSTNMIFSKDKDSNISLCKAFDYEISFEKELDLQSISNPFLDRGIEETQDFFYYFPTAYETFRLIAYIDLDKMLQDIIDEYNLNVPENLIEEYLTFDKERKALVKQL